MTTIVNSRPVVLTEIPPPRSALARDEATRAADLALLVHGWVTEIAQLPTEAQAICGD